jgi:hypothetical protein
MTNQFLNKVQSGDCRTDNGALSNSSTSNVLVDQFGVSGSQRGRDIGGVFNDQAILHNYDADLALKFVFYLRMITRNVNIKGETTDKPQKGQGARDESFKRFLWYAVNQPKLFYENLWLFPVVGSWKDIWNIMFLAYKNDISLDKTAIFSLIQMGIDDVNEKELIKKFLPRIRSNKKCLTDWSKYTNSLAKEFTKMVGWSEKEYRNFKSTGTAHEFQKLICSKKYDLLNFNSIPGKALFNLTKGKFLSKHNLEKRFENWISKQPVAKFTGYVYELGREVDSNGINMPLYKKLTLDKQFKGLVELAKKSANDGVLGKRNVICAIDRSGSMYAKVGNTTCINIAESLGIYFASLMEGVFHNWVIKFSSRSEWVQLQGDSFVDRKRSMQWGDCPSSTDWLSVINSIVNVRKNNPNIPLEEFPSVVLTVSDMQFDRFGWWYGEREPTNYETAKRMLLTVFPQKWVDDFQFIWWQVNGNKKDFPATMNDGGCYIVSGFDGAIITTLLGGAVKPNKERPDMLDIVKEALNQEVLTLIKI